MGQYRRALSAAALSLLCAFAAAPAAAQIVAAGIPGHWEGTSDTGFGVTLDLLGDGTLTGTLSGPGLTGCVFDGSVPPSGAVQNDASAYDAFGLVLVFGCADRTVDAPGLALVRATPGELSFTIEIGTNGAARFVEGMRRTGDANTTGLRQLKGGMWSSAGESGWGLSVALGGTAERTPFAVLFVYSGTSPTWFVMPSGAWTGSSRFDGDLFATTGTDWRTQPFDPRSVTVTKVGTLSMTFTSDTGATLVYEIADSTGTTRRITKAMQKQQF